MKQYVSPEIELIALATDSLLHTSIEYIPIVGKGNGGNKPGTGNGGSLPGAKSTHGLHDFEPWSKSDGYNKW